MTNCILAHNLQPSAEMSIKLIPFYICLPLISTTVNCDDDILWMIYVKKNYNRKYLIKRTHNMYLFLNVKVIICVGSLLLFVLVALVYGVKRHFQQYFSYNVHVAVSFIVGGNRSTRRKPPTCCMSLTNFII